MASSAANGSSISSTCCPAPSARASATRCRMPPDSSCTRLLAGAVQPDQLEQLARASLAPLGRGDAAQPQRQLDVLRRGQPREQRRLLEHQRRPAAGTSTVPAVGSSRPATRFSRVDLPQPEAPSRQTNSPGAHVEVDVVEHRRRRRAEDLRDVLRSGPRPRGGAVDRGRRRLAGTAWSPVALMCVLLVRDRQSWPRPPAETGSWPSASSTLLSSARS